ncbi:MAG: dUTP diphosphatase [Candidatus Neptunochlamydia sp.]|nr:dUTP diphosphatase [Candidatus Neptunochlamydia sp.]
MMNNDVPTVLEEGVELPLYGSKEAAGADVRAYITDEMILNSGESRLIPTGLRFEIPKGFEIQIRPRSGLALKHGVTVLNAPGTIDSDYRGEVGVILINHGKNPFVITPKMRIAQLVFARVIQACYKEEECLKGTERGEGGFGHTGRY